jgi:hypothetical protein
LARSADVPALQNFLRTVCHRLGILEFARGGRERPDSAATESGEAVDDADKLTALRLVDEMSETGNYVKRGRTHEGLSASELESLCIAELRLLVERYGPKNEWQGVSDVLAEYRLRGIDDLPKGAATELVDRLVALHGTKREKMKLEDPERFARTDAAIDLAVENLGAPAEKPN